jgi:hypothetical protein
VVVLLAVPLAWPAVPVYGSLARENSADYVVQILVPAETFQFLTPCCKIPNTVGVKLQDSPLISTVLFLTCAMTED